MREPIDEADERGVPTYARRIRELQDRFEPTFGGRCVERILELRPFERGLGLASRGFVALLPLIIVASR